MQVEGREEEEDFFAIGEMRGMTAVVVALDVAIPRTDGRRRREARNGESMWKYEAFNIANNLPISVDLLQNIENKFRSL